MALNPVSSCFLQNIFEHSVGARASAGISWDGASAPEVRAVRSVPHPLARKHPAHHHNQPRARVRRRAIQFPTEHLPHPPLSLETQLPGQNGAPPRRLGHPPRIRRDPSRWLPIPLRAISGVSPHGASLVNVCRIERKPNGTCQRAIPSSGGAALGRWDPRPGVSDLPAPAAPGPP
jgi:hypothetical protein